MWDYSVSAIKWIPTWQGLDGFQTSLLSCALDESSLSIESAKRVLNEDIHMDKKRPDLAAWPTLRVTAVDQTDIPCLQPITMLYYL